MKKNRFLAVAISGMLLTSVCLTSCKKEEAPQTETPVEKTAVWSAPSTRKYMLNESAAEQELDLSIVMCKNESEGVQLMITPAENVTDYNVTVSDLKSGENTISKSAIQVYREHYLYMYETNHQATFGYYPDPLVPIEISRAAGENVIEKGANQAILIDVTTEASTPAGVYEGTVTLTINEETQEIPFQVTVKNVTVPETHYAKRAFALWETEMDYGVNSNIGVEEYIDNAYELMIDYAIAPTDLPNVETKTPEQQIAQMVEYAAREDVACFSLPYKKSEVSAAGYGVYTSFDYEHMKTMLRGLVEASTNENNYVKKAYFYLTQIDEQYPETYWKVIDTNDRFKAVKDELAAEEGLFEGKDEVLEAFYAVEHVVTLTQTKDLYDGAETEPNLYTPCPQYQLLSNSEYYSLMAERMAKGNSYWWYGCNVPQKPNPSLHTDDSLLIAREISYMQKFYGISGELYWCANVNGMYESLLGTYMSRDIWKDPLSVGASGDGYLIYPAAKYGEEYKTQSFPGLRLMAIRDGAEDYDLLCVLEEELAAACEKYDLDITLNEYLADWYVNVFSGVRHDDDYALLEAFRQEIISMIELLQAGACPVVERNDITHHAEVKIYAEDGVSVAVNGETLSGVATFGGQVFTKQVLANAAVNYATLSATKDGRTVTAEKYLGQFWKTAETFNGMTQADVNQIEVSKYRNRTGVSLTLNEDVAYSLSGNSLCADISYINGEGYLPEFYIDVTGGGEYADYGAYDSVSAQVYNDSDRAVLLSLQLADCYLSGVEVGSFLLQPKTWTRVAVKDLTGKIDMTQLVAVSFEFKNEQEGKRIYVENIAFGKATPDDKKATTLTELSGEFGLYEKEYAPKKRVLENGLLCGFNSADDLPWTVSFTHFTQNNTPFTASINTDSQYISEGSGSLKFAYTLQAFYDLAICPSIYFRLPESEWDFSRPVTISFDVYNASDVDISYQIKTYNLFDMARWEYTYKEVAGDGTEKSEFTVAAGSGKQTVRMTLQVDYGNYYGGAVPKDVKYIRLLLPTTGSADATLYIDNFKIIR